MPFGKITRFLSHVSLLTLSHSHWSTTESFLATSFGSISLCLHTVAMDSTFILFNPLVDLISSGNNQPVLSSFLSGTSKMDLTLRPSADVDSMTSTSSSRPSTSPSSSPDSEFQSSYPSLTPMVTLGEVGKQTGCGPGHRSRSTGGEHRAPHRTGVF